MENKEHILTGDEVVISGISGIFPNSENVLEFGENLFTKVDMVCDAPRWSTNNPEIPKHVGKINDIEKFDAQFFKVGYQQAKILDPISRKILEHAYGAIFDSGNTHATVKGKKIGVFIGSSFADFSSLCFYDIEKRTDFVVGGSSKSMLANRISYWVDGRGPSYCLDYSCVSSTAALEKAYHCIKKGECDAAVVGAGNICSNPTLSHNLKSAGFLCLDGKTKCFDKNADGYVRAEAVTLLFLEKAKDAKRIYAEVYHAKGMYALKEEPRFSLVHKSDKLQKFLTEFYLETDIRPENIEYVEANGAAIAEADAEELDAIGKIFTNGRTVKVGCVKSNMGHSEAVSGLCAVAKMCLSYHRGVVPANLHLNASQDHIPAISEGKLQIVTEHSKFDRGYAAINNFSFTGANYHVVLKGHYKEKNLEKYKSEVPRIVLASGREESCVCKIFDSLKTKPVDPEEIALLHSIFEKDVPGHTGRGYLILDTDARCETASVSESVDYYSGVRRPLWFVFSGMGSQWTGMGADLMRIPTFARAIYRCHKVLAPKGIDIVKIITEPDKTIFDSILNAFVGIGAVQIGLTDILKEMGVDPDYIIGHSLGEMACAYHDNTFTTEELILSTYSRGMAVNESSLIKGSMAAVGLGYRDLLSQCPPDIDIGCHNSAESATLSGPAASMRAYVADLTKRGVFAREVPSANIAYHSRYMADAGPALLQRLREVITVPKARSAKWISTSVPKALWGEESARYSSPEYHMNNMLSPVLFEECLSMIPPNAVIVEVAPHGLLQAILKRSHPEATHIPLTKRGCSDGVLFLLEAVGKLYQAGYNPKVGVLYPEVDFPVSTQTPLLSHLVQWDHTENWPLLKIDKGNKILSSTRDLIISAQDDDHKYIADHIVNGMATIPEASLLVYVWQTLAMYRGMDYRYISVIFRDVTFHSNVIVTSEEIVQLSIMISKGNDRFEISQNDKLIASGVANGVTNLMIQHTVDSQEDDFDDIVINSDDVYRIFNMRGHCYKGALKSIYSVNITQKYALIEWKNDWISLLDSLIQFNALMRDHNGFSKPRFIRKLRIDVAEQELNTKLIGDKIKCLTAQIKDVLGITRCAGIEIDNITYLDKPNKISIPEVLKEKSFFPYFATKEIDMKSALEINFQVIAENFKTKDIKIIHITNAGNPQIPDIYCRIKEVTDWIININTNINSVTITNNIKGEKAPNLDVNLTNVLVFENLLQNAEVMKYFHASISEEDFILTLEDQIPEKNHIKKHFNVLTCMTDGTHILILLRKINHSMDTLYLPVTDNFSWVNKAYGELATTKKVVLVLEKKPCSGLVGFVKKLKSDGYKNISMVEIRDFHAQPFIPTTDFYKDQLGKNLVVNILKKGQWGSYFYTSCSQSASARSFSLKTLVPGDLDTLEWVESTPLLPKKTLVQVCYAGLSARDCQIAANKFRPDNEEFGMDFSGMDKNGERVMGLTKGSMSSTLEADPNLLWPVPEYWSLEDAATVPLPYIHAFYCLMIRGKLKKYQSVLITGAAGAFGQAVIAICLSVHCTVYAAVDDSEKKKFILQRFPTLNENNISYSDHDNLYNMVMWNTLKQGCDLVINGTGILRETAMNCVGSSGIYLDVNKQDLFENKELGMAYLNKERSYVNVDVSNIFGDQFSADKKVLQNLLKKGIDDGVVMPLVRVVYSPTMVTRAFRLLSCRRNRARVLVRIRDPIVMNQGLKVFPRLSYTHQDVIVVICDEKGVGVELADRFIERGLRKVILHMKPSLRTGYLQTKFISWSKHEVSVKLSAENLHTDSGCAVLMKSAVKFGRVIGVFVVQDAIKGGTGEKEFTDASNMSMAIMNLDMASRNCADLSQFVIVSDSIHNACDEYALSFLERICEQRNEMGLPSLVIRRGSTGVHDSRISNKELDPQLLRSLLDSLETSLLMKYKNVLTLSREQDALDFNKKIGAVLGINDVNNISKDTLLNDLGINETNLNELRSVIADRYHVDYPIDYMRRMTIQKLTEHYKNVLKKATDFDCGMFAFYKEIVDEKDYVSQQPVVVMPTLLNNCDEVFVDPNNTYLIMLPGFDGSSETLKTISQRLKIQSVGIQLGPDMAGESISEIASNVRETIKTKLTCKSKFYIFGYSFGANIALELAAIFESEGHFGVVYLLDSSPDALRAHINSYLDNPSDKQLQNDIFYHICDLMTGYEAKNNIYLQDIETLEEKLDICLKHLKVVPWSDQYKRNLLDAAYKRLKLAKEYNPKAKLSSKIVLMKGIPHPKLENLGEDYNLSKVSQSVTIFNINCDHSSACGDCSVSNIINKFLDAEILEAFSKQNFCNIYLSKP